MKKYTERSSRSEFDVIVLGASKGGFTALQVLLGGFPRDFPLPVLIAYHRGTEKDNLTVDLQEISLLKISEALDKQKILPGEVYFAPPDYHLLVEKGGWLALSTEGPVNHSRPSIDVLFESAASSYRERVIAIVLTGSSSDGTIGATKIKQNGGTVIIENPETALDPVMPKSVYNHVKADAVLRIEELAEYVNKICDAGTR